MINLGEFEIKFRIENVDFKINNWNRIRTIQARTKGIGSRDRGRLTYHDSAVLLKNASDESKLKSDYDFGLCEKMLEKMPKSKISRSSKLKQFVTVKNQ